MITLLYLLLVLTQEAAANDFLQYSQLATRTKLVSCNEGKQALRSWYKFQQLSKKQVKNNGVPGSI